MDINMKPATIMQIAGGLVLLLATFLDWFGTTNAWKTESFGLMGILIALIGAAVGGGTAAGAFGVVSLPDRIIGFSHAQLHMALGLAAFIPTFGFQFASHSEIGITLAWIAAAVIMAGAFMEMKDDSPSAPPPTQF